MKQNIKRLWLMVCMVFCLFALSACSAAEDSGQALDAELSEGLCSVTEGILELCTELSAEELEQQGAFGKQMYDVLPLLFGVPETGNNDNRQKSDRSIQI